RGAAAAAHACVAAVAAAPWGEALKKLLLVSNDEVGPQMAGPGIRYYHFARELSKRFDVTLVVPTAPKERLGAFDVLQASEWRGRRFRSLARRYDVVVAQTLRAWTMYDLAPFGTESEPPVATERALKGAVPGIGEDDKVLLWGGGIWNWFDPLTPIRAVHTLARTREDVKLFFLGVKHPNPGVQQLAMTGRAVELAKELGLYDRFVFFNFGWVPYGERANFLLDA